MYNHGMYAERDLHYRDGDYYDIQHGSGDPFDGIASGRGLGRLIAAIGIIVAMAGFGGFMYVIFSGFSSTDTGAALVGGIIASVGGSMARPARRRQERAAYYRRRRF